MKLINGNEVDIPFDPELDVFCGVKDSELTEKFRQAVEIANMEKRLKGTPIPVYDPKTKQAYLEFPDGRREYA